MFTNNNSDVNNTSSHTNGSSTNLNQQDQQQLTPAKETNILPFFNQTTSNLPKSNKKRSSTGHLVATKEFVIKEDHNEYKCEIEGCDKSCRKESMLRKHIQICHKDIYESYIKRKLESEGNNTSSSTNYYLDDSLSNDVSFNKSSTKKIPATNENSNTSWNSEHHHNQQLSQLTEIKRKKKENS